MDATHAAKLKETLLKEKAQIEQQLGMIAQKNPAIKGDWTALQTDISDASDTLDEKAQNITVYEERRAVEHSFELRLQEIEKTLVSLSQGSYGVCTTCNIAIPQKRLAALPAVQLCFDCANNSTLA